MEYFEEFTGQGRETAIWATGVTPSFNMSAFKRSLSWIKYD